MNTRFAWLCLLFAGKDYETELMTECGTPYWSAPELFQGLKYNEVRPLRTQQPLWPGPAPPVQAVIVYDEARPCAPCSLQS